MRTVELQTLSAVGYWAATIVTVTARTPASNCCPVSVPRTKPAPVPAWVPTPNGPPVGGVPVSVVAPAPTISAGPAAVVPPAGIVTGADHSAVPPLENASVTDLAVVSGVRPATVASCALGWKANPVNATVFGPGRLMVTPVRSAMPTTGRPVAGVGLLTLNTHPGTGARHMVWPVVPDVVAPPGAVATTGPVTAVPPTFNDTTVGTCDGSRVPDEVTPCALPASGPE